MKRHDRDGDSARFSRITSIVSAWVITTTTVGVGQLVSNRFMTYQVPLWFALLMGLIAFTVASVVLRPGDNNQHHRRSKQVFFILCAFNEKRWIAGLIQDLYRSLDIRGIDLVLKIPERDYVHLGQVRHLRNLSDQHGGYIGGIISPAEPELLRHDLRNYCASADHPVVFVDIDPFNAVEDYPAGTAFVGYSPEAIGRCAADYVGEHARRSQVSSPSVLVIGSNKLHIGRQTEFVKQLELQLRDAEFAIDESGDFDRTRAREIAYEHLRSELAVPNYIFCTNDEMALGAVDALIVMGLENDGPVVVGVDGILEARALIDSRNTPLRATVVQDSCRMAEIATNILDKAIRGEQVEKCNYLDPQIYSKDR